VDIQVQELIDRIRRDGIASATEEASRITAAAEAEALRIVEAARKEAGELTAKAGAEADRAVKAGTAALTQASRNLLLVFRDEVQALLDRLVARETGAAFDADVLKKVLPEVIAAWGGKKGDMPDLLLGEASLASLRAFFDDKLAKELKAGLELKPDAGLGSGFRIAEKDGSAYYDFSGEAVAAMLGAYLNPRLSAVMSEAAGGGGR